jgi:hypothetical protein
MLLAKLAQLALASVVWWGINIPLYIAGLFVTPAMIALSHTDSAGLVHAPRAFWIWDNDEDGMDPEWYRQANPTWSRWRRMYAWTALRNSVNNMRFVRWISPPLQPYRVQYMRLSRGWIAWQGCYVGLLYGPIHHGYNINPDDAEHPELVRASDWRYGGIGFRTGVQR